MSSITVFGSLSANVTGSLTSKLFVQHPVESFEYRSAVGADVVPLDFVGDHELDARHDVHIIDESWRVPVNSPVVRTGVQVSSSSTFNSIYKHIQPTNKTFSDARGAERPLWYSHRFDSAPTSVRIKHVVQGNMFQQEDVAVYYDLDEENAVYATHPNRYDLDTNNYHLMFISATFSDGSVSNELFAAQPAATEATWEDIDTTTGRLRTDRAVYTRTYTGGQWQFGFSQGGPWWVKPINTGTLQIHRPAQIEPSEPWYLRFSNGDVTANVNGSLNRYYLPEYDDQPFAPYKPALFVPDQEVQWLGPRVLVMPHERITIDTTRGIHLQLRIYDHSGTLIRVFTTDSSVDNTNYSNTQIKQEYGHIGTWSERQGIVSLATKLMPEYTIKASYYYETEWFELNEIDINPVTNPDLRGRSIGFYVNANATTRALEWFAIDENGLITDVSEESKKVESGGVYNAATIVGQSIDAWVAAITTELFLGVVSVSKQWADPHLLDVRREAYLLDSAYTANPKLLQSRFGYDEEGMQIPTDDVVFVRVPLSVLSDYGGTLTKERVQEEFDRITPAHKQAVIQWWYPRSDVSLDETTVTQVTASWQFRGDYTYRLYRRQGTLSTWTLINTQTPGARTDMTYVDTGLTSGELYSYVVRIVDNGQEYDGVYSTVKVL